MRRDLVTGSAGFIGFHLAKLLLVDIIPKRPENKDQIEPGDSLSPDCPDLLL
jgi:nucleoside-diphosphate-sugar epimerase